MSEQQQAKNLSNIRIVMIHTSHTGNMGAAARAMKVMGLSQLVLVKPKTPPDEQAKALAANAADILDQAHIVDTLDEAIADCQLVIGSSARFERNLRWQIQDARHSAETIATHAQHSKVAILFGRESSGLSNEELARCQHLVHIPTNPDYSSLNVASAVQILAYECRLATLQLAQTTDHDNTNPNSADDWATTRELEGYFDHLKKVLIKIEFLNPQEPKQLLLRLRRLYMRTHLQRNEINILRGILNAIEKHLK